MVELAGDTQEVGQVVVAEPDHVDAFDGGDRIDVLDALGGLDQRDHHRARIGLRDLVGLGAACIVVMRGDIERGAATACRRISGAIDDRLGLLDVSTIGTMMPIAPMSSARAM